MEEKQPNNKAAEKQNKKVYLIGGIVALVVIAVLIVGMVVGLIGPNRNMIPTVEISTPYVDLLIPMEVAEYISYEESTYGDTYTCAFYMNYSGNKLLLWRVDFGDPDAAGWVGILQTEQGDIPVAITGFVTSDEELATLGEEGTRLYGECMQGYSVMLDSLKGNPKFTSERPLEIGENTERKLTYWTVTLPEKMSVVESSEGENYTAIFSGEVVGEMVMMYRITIGDEQNGSLLGYFNVDGVKKAVTVEGFSLVERESWNEADYAAAYHMMDTINYVIETIMSSKQFSQTAE